MATTDFKKAKITSQKMYWCLNFHNQRCQKLVKAFDAEFNILFDAGFKYFPKRNGSTGQRDVVESRDEISSFVCFKKLEKIMKRMWTLCLCVI